MKKLNFEAAIEQKIKETVKDEVAKALGSVIEALPEQDTSQGHKWLTAKEFCKHYNMSRSTLQRMRHQDRVDVIDGGGRFVRFRWKGEKND